MFTFSCVTAVNVWTKFHACARWFHTTMRTYVCLEGSATISLYPYMFTLMLHRYLNRSVQIRSFEAKVDLAGNWQADEQPVIKTEVVDQLEDVGHGQVEQRHSTLGR